MAFVNSFKDLEVYKLSRKLASLIFKLTFPTEGRYSLTDQIRRSSRSIGGQIAESMGKRRFINHFISKLTDGDAEQFETQHWTEVAYDCGYISLEQENLLLEKCIIITHMLNSMINKADLFCRKAP